MYISFIVFNKKFTLELIVEFISIAGLVLSYLKNASKNKLPILLLNSINIGFFFNFS